MTEFKIFYWEPRAVVCTRRGKDFGSLEFDAEIQFGDSQRVIATGLKTYEEAQRIGDELEKKIKEDLLKTVNKHIEHLKHAKE